MRHSARSWWLDEAGDVDVASPLLGDLSCDVVVVGGGYTGLWTALGAASAGASVVVVEADVCGHGPSGRNGGFCEDLWLSLPSLRARFGDAAALALCRESEASVEAIEAFCAARGVDAWFHRAGQLVVSAAPAQDGVGADAVEAAAALGVPSKVVALSAREVRARFGSPVARGGVLLPTGASVQPARLALGLRAAVRDVGVRVFERTPARRVVVRPGGVEVLTPTGRVRASRAVLAAGGALAAFGPLRGALTVGSSHIVLTEPVPDVLEELGWTGGETVTDGRALLHYTRTTADDRIVFGWAGGRPAFGARLRGRVEVDAAVAREAREHLVRFFPALRGREVTHAWGGPIDIAPAHLPFIRSVAGGRVWSAAGYTGNGVGPSHLVGRILAALAVDARDDVTRLPLVDPPSGRVPPEPLRYAGASLTTAAIRRKEGAEERGDRADPVTAFVASLPERLGVTVGR
jgi:glycine/D-amino acid oxidase-like deaminating enzyme